MQAAQFLFSPNGRLKPQPFIYGALGVYLFGVASHLLTTPDVITHGGLWPFIAAQILLLWIWFVLHAKRLHDAGRSGGLAAGVALLYALSLVAAVDRRRQLLQYVGRSDDERHRDERAWAHSPALRHCRH